MVYAIQIESQDSHKSVSKLLFNFKRSIEDINMYFSFLSTIVKSTDKDNSGKLKSILKYIFGSI